MSLPRSAAVVLGLALVVACAIEPWLVWGHQGVGWAWWSLAGACAVATSLVTRHRASGASVALVSLVAGGSWVAHDGTLIMSFVVSAVVVSFLVGRHDDDPRSAVIAIGVIGAGLTVLSLVVEGSPVGDWPGQAARALGNHLVFVGLPWLVGRHLRQVAIAHDRDIDQAQTRERARIAQEMHDSLGHDLSLIAVRAAALQVAQGLPGQHQEAAGAIRTAAASATERLGQIVGLLRPEGQPAPLEPAPTSVSHLVERARDSGMKVSLETDDEAWPPAQAAVAHRVVQEGLTNAARHAPGAGVDVVVATSAACRRVSVTNGVALDSPEPGPTSRTGLSGLAAAAQALSGDLTYGPTGTGGFCVAAEFPRRPSAAGDLGTP